MGNFFHGWRRKLGVVTLMVACVLSVGWERSLRVDEECFWRCGQRCMVLIGSGHGLIMCGRSLANMPNFLQERFELFDWHSEPLDSGQTFDSSRHEFRWIWNFLGFRLGFRKRNRLPTQMDENMLVTIPYWSIVVPLTLVSVYLLLRKPSPRTLKKPDEPIPATVP